MDTPANVYCGRAEMILAERQCIKRETTANRRLQQAAKTLTPDEPEPPFSNCLIGLKLSDEGHVEIGILSAGKRISRTISLLTLSGNYSYLLRYIDVAYGAFTARVDGRPGTCPRPFGQKNRQPFI